MNNTGFVFINLSIRDDLMNGLLSFVEHGALHVLILTSDISGKGLINASALVRKCGKRRARQHSDQAEQVLNSLSRKGYIKYQGKPTKALQPYEVRSDLFALTAAACGG